jgi:molybdopterin/thiamine biosynthesis adenylyltransferase
LRDLQPLLLDPATESGWTQVEALRARDDLRFVPALRDSLDDLFRIDFPFVAPSAPEYSKTFNNWLEHRWNHGRLDRLGAYAYLPWRAALVHLPGLDEFLRLRTARNRFLVSDEEQRRFYDAEVGVAGLSVGLSVVATLVMSGGGGRLRIADFDSLALVNLNRLLGSVADIGVPKTTLAARRVYELDPFAELEVVTEGITEAGVQAFVDGLDVLIEEMDDIFMKIAIRLAARRARVPVVMATDNGDNTIIDVERFDLDPDYPLFHGRVDEGILRNCPRNPALADRVRLADAIVGRDVTTRMQASLQAVGSRLPTWPQLGTAATLSGVGTAYAVRRLACGDALPSGRYRVSLDEVLDPTYAGPEAEKVREEATREFSDSFEVIFGANSG